VGFATKQPKKSLRHYVFRGKCAFDPKPKYRVNDAISGNLKKYPVKAFNNEGAGRGLKVLWEKVIGYSKRELIVDDGHIYITEPSKSGNICRGLYAL
jgi:hypothetical protein